MGQHNSFGKDIDLIAEAYGGMMLGGAHMMQGAGVAQQAADALAHEDGYNSPEEAAEEHDKTGHLSDKEIVAKAKQMGTAGSWLIDAAEKHVHSGGSLPPGLRDDLARDVEGRAEKHIAAEDEGAYAGVEKAEAGRRESEDVTAANRGFRGPVAKPAH